MITTSLAVVAAAAIVQGVAAAKCSQSCYYQVKADMEWSAARHPTDYPSGKANWSPFWTVAHDSSFYLWRGGELANPGIQEIAEFGSGESFMDEVEACGGSCGPGEGIPCEPMSGTCSAMGKVLMSPDKPYFSSASMIAPSPDWFAGVDSWELCKNGEWVDMMEATLYAYDAGTDSGATFLAEDEPLGEDAEPIFGFQSITPESDSIFYNPDEGKTFPMGTLYVKLAECMDKEMDVDMGGMDMKDMVMGKDMADMGGMYGN